MTDVSLVDFNGVYMKDSSLRHYKGDLDFDLQPHPRPWPLELVVMEWKQTLQGICTGKH